MVCSNKLLCGNGAAALGGLTLSKFHEHLAHTRWVPFILVIHHSPQELDHVVMAANPCKHTTLATNRLNLVLIVPVVPLHGKDALVGSVLSQDTGAKTSFTQWSNIIHHVVTVLVVEVIFPGCEIVLEGVIGCSIVQFTVLDTYTENDSTVITSITTKD